MLLDHFRPPLDHAHSWEELHGQWPAVIVQHLRTRLPAGYEAAPRVHSGSQVEIVRYAAHMPILERPAAVNRAVERFVEQQVRSWRGTVEEVGTP